MTFPGLSKGARVDNHNGGRNNVQAREILKNDWPKLI